MIETFKLILSDINLFIALYGPAIMAILASVGTVITFFAKIKSLTAKSLTKSDVEETNLELRKTIEQLTLEINKQNREISQLKQCVTKVHDDPEV